MMLWAGFFGIDTDGNQPECNNEIEAEFSEGEIEYDAALEGYITSAFTCPRCKNVLEWPQTWDIVHNPTEGGK